MKIVVFKKEDLLEMQIALLQCIYFSKKSLEDKNIEREYKQEINNRIDKYNEILKKLERKEKNGRKKNGR